MADLLTSGRQNISCLQHIMDIGKTRWFGLFRGPSNCFFHSANNPRRNPGPQDDHKEKRKKSTLARTKKGLGTSISYSKYDMQGRLDVRRQMLKTETWTWRAGRIFYRIIKILMSILWGQKWNVRFWNAKTELPYNSRRNRFHHRYHGPMNRKYTDPETRWNQNSYD